jgi:two-component system response regulator YesN
MPDTILLIDDDKDFRREFVEYFEDYTVLEAENGETGLKLLRSINIIDLVILDVRMPGQKGTKVLQKIKAYDQDLYTIIMTGYSTEEVAIESLKARADDYLVKPVNFFILKESIDRIVKDMNYTSGLDENSIETKIEKIIHYIRRNPHKSFNLNDIAGVMFLSPKYISKIFKEHTGQCFNDYKLNVKVEYARELLLNTGYTIDQISFKLGYKKAESFIRIFKKIMHQTPTQFRRSVKGEGPFANEKR